MCRHRRREPGARSATAPNELPAVLRADRDGRLPIHIACDCGHLELVKWLHANGAALDVAGNIIVGGISYDFRKCFDLIDIPLLMAVMAERGMDPGVLRALNGMYTQLVRRLKLGG